RQTRVPLLYASQAAQRPTLLFAALLRPTPTLDRGLLAAREGEVLGGRGGGDDRSRADRGVVAHLHRRDQRRVGTDEGTIADLGDVLVHAVVVARDGAGADVHVRTDLRVAEIGEVVGLAAFAEFGFLGFDEISDMRPRRKFGSGTQTRERPDPARPISGDPYQI